MTEQTQNNALLAQMAPDSEPHKKLVSILRKKINASENAICRFYPNWTRAENTYYAYLSRASKTAAAAKANDLGQAPEVIDFVQPAAFAQVNTVVAYLLSVFCTQERTFTLKGYGPEDDKNAQNMERMLQIELEQGKFVNVFRQFFMDGLIYGFGAMKTEWEVKTRPQNIPDGAGGMMRQDMPVSEGTKVSNIDPYRFLPDPRVPIGKCATEGEFVFWRDSMQPYRLREGEAMGKLLYTKNIPAGDNDDMFGNGKAGGFNRNQRWGQYDASIEESEIEKSVIIHHGTIQLDPKDLGLVDDEKKGIKWRSQKYIVAIANKQRIIQFEPYDCWHDMHPVVVCEPYSQGYEFMSPGLVEYVADFQQLISWVGNSRMFNVRASTQGMTFVDPSQFEPKDLQNKSPGKVVRLLPSAQGHDIKRYVQHVNQPDVTSGWIGDIRMLLSAMDNTSGVSDALRGVDTYNKEQTATEVNAKQASATNRVAALAKTISSQALSPLAEQMIMNRQQYMELPSRVTEDGDKLKAENFQGAFRFIIHDGTLPQARQQEVNFLREILQAAPNMPELAAEYDIKQVLEAIALRSGIDLKAYRKTDEQKAQEAQNQPQELSPEQIKLKEKIADLQFKIQELQIKGNLDVQMQQQKLEYEKQLTELKEQYKQETERMKAELAKQAKENAALIAANASLQKEREKPNPEPSNPIQPPSGRSVTGLGKALEKSGK